jgi:N-acetylglutamate synthase/N-acetylornithine aminotransferase
MALAGRELEELGPDHIDADALGSDDEEAEIAVRLGRGSDSAHLYFSDLNYEYVRINAEYTT